MAGDELQQMLKTNSAAQKKEKNKGPALEFDTGREIGPDSQLRSRSAGADHDRRPPGPKWPLQRSRLSGGYFPALAKPAGTGLSLPGGSTQIGDPSPHPLFHPDPHFDYGGAWGPVPTPNGRVLTLCAAGGEQRCKKEGESRGRPTLQSSAD